MISQIKKYVFGNRVKQKIKGLTKPEKRMMLASKSRMKLAKKIISLESKKHSPFLFVNQVRQLPLKMGKFDIWSIIMKVLDHHVSHSKQTITKVSDNVLQSFGDKDRMKRMQ